MSDTDDERADDLDLGGIGERRRGLDPGEDGIASEPHMPVDDDEAAEDR